MRGRGNPRLRKRVHFHRKPVRVLCLRREVPIPLVNAGRYRAPLVVRFRGVGTTSGCSGGLWKCLLKTGMYLETSSSPALKTGASDRARDASARHLSRFPCNAPWILFPMCAIKASNASDCAAASLLRRFSNVFFYRWGSTPDRYPGPNAEAVRRVRIGAGPTEACRPLPEPIFHSCDSGEKGDAHGRLRPMRCCLLAGSAHGGGRRSQASRRMPPLRWSRGS